MYTVYSTQTCQYCKAAKDLLNSRGFHFEEILLRSPADIKPLSERVGFEVKTVPQIFHNDEYIGGFTDLQKYIQ